MDKYINIAKDYTPTPLGRYRKHGPFSGQRFREEFLVPALKEHEKLVVNFDGVAGLPSSFLEEAFGGLIRGGFVSVAEFYERVLIEVSNPALALVTHRIKRYVTSAKVAA